MFETFGGFWSHALNSLGDNLDIFAAVGSDIADNLNPLSEQFASGNAQATAAEVERQRARDEGREIDPARVAASSGGGLGRIGDAASVTIDDVKAATGEVLDTTAKAAGGLLDALTNPYVLGIGAVLVGLVLVAPYAVPALKAVS